jgi:hypothetical protein
MAQKTAVRTFFALLVTLVVYCLLWQAISAHLTLPSYYYARLIELLGIFLFAALALLIPMRFEEMGIAVPLPLLFRSLALGLGVALLVILLPAGSVMLWRRMPLSAFFKAGNIARFTYILVAPLQEVLAKSVMYYSFELCFERRHPHLANLLCALVFGLFHVVYGAPMMLLSMALSLATGWIFQKYRCVWGCAAAHFAIGFFYDCFAF